MTRAIEFDGVVKQGHLPPAIRLSISDALKRAEGKRVRIKLAEYRKRRSTRQNNYYKGVVVPMFRDYINSFGNSVDKNFADRLIKLGIGYFDEVKMPDGTVEYNTRSSADLDTIQFNDFVEKTIAWIAQEWSFEIPLPNEYAEDTPPVNPESSAPDTGSDI